MTQYIDMTKKGIVELKEAELLVIRLLNTRRASEFWSTLNKILFLIRDVGSRTKEYKEELESYV